MAKKDLDLLQGIWTVTTLEIDGEKVSPDVYGNATVVIKGSRFTSEGMGDIYQGTVELDASANPRRIDMKFDAGPEKGNTNPGIYKLAGDSWTLCLATRGKKRPSSFKSKPDSGIALETLTRGKRGRPASKEAKTISKTVDGGVSTEFEGEWQMVSAVMNGKPMEEALVRWVKRYTTGNETIVKAGPQTMLKVQFTYDASKSPKTIDYLNLAGGQKGKTQLGIYEFEGGLLKVCVAPPGATRPEEFKSVAGDARTLTVWKKRPSA
jgi:uncharacterized protein (TIGR03067 family)